MKLVNFYFHLKRILYFYSILFDTVVYKENNYEE